VSLLICLQVKCFNKCSLVMRPTSVARWGQQNCAAGGQEEQFCCCAEGEI